MTAEARTFHVRTEVAVLVTVAADAIDAALFRLPPTTREDDVESLMAELAATDALGEWARVAGCDLVPPFDIIETDADGVPLAPDDPGSFTR